MPKKSKKTNSSEIKNSISNSIMPLLITSIIGGFLGGFSYAYFFPQESVEPIIIEEALSNLQQPKPLAKEISLSELNETQNSINLSLLNESSVKIYKTQKENLNPSIKQFNEKSFVSFGTILTSDGWIATHDSLSNAFANYTVLDSHGNAYSLKGKPVIDKKTNTTFFKIDAHNLNVQPFKDYLANKELDNIYSLLISNEVFENKISHTSALITKNPDNVIFDGDAFYHYIKTQNEFPKEAIGGPVFSVNGDIIGLIKDTKTITPFKFIQPALKHVFKGEEILHTKLGINSFIDLSLINYKIDETQISKGALIYKLKGSAIVKGSAAEKAELKLNDIITKIDNDEISEKKTLPYLLSEYPKGSSVEITILRDGLEKKIEVQL